MELSRVIEKRLRVQSLWWNQKRQAMYPFLKSYWKAFKVQMDQA